MATALINISSVPINILILLFILPSACSTNFQIARFDATAANIVYEGDAVPSVGVIELIDKVNYVCRVGRATYAERVPLWDCHAGKAADFTTHFSFIVDTQGAATNGSGFGFFLAPFGFQIPLNSAGGFLGLFNTTTSDFAGNHIVLVEFDSYVNPDWDPAYQHVGINNSIASVVMTPWNVSLHDGDTTDVWISYNATTTSLKCSVELPKYPCFSIGDN
ncbi:putative non-specific serine/threonine protein kinase [Rosa chinensis]|uniref:Putative non-specific serine/threonine protein kinase n=1 Tax=Rosa chinensis TaxID=74649 RepID=A0A2P6RQ42_ROSCH|nr:putative non-specific serine/threonine protein kinase [Rosa chinensis]